MQQRSELQRNKPLKRAGTLKRNKPLRMRRRSRSKHELVMEAELLSALFAKAEARRMRHCQNPECAENPKSPNYDPRLKPQPWEAHHVVFEQEIVRLGLPRWNTMNVLRLCKTCHHHHHDGTQWKLPLTALRKNNYAFAFRVMGERAFDYLRRHYSGEDPRLNWYLGAWRHGR